jgi:DNA replication licensing factor MCM2
MPRAIYTTGKGASAVGLTAGVHKDPLTKEWTLEGGALVLADNGMCCIDEFDKMNEQDRTSIHEAMEQQSISVSKAGIVTSLQARCAVVAAANPIGGQYDSSATFADNVELTDPILQRFDILCVLQDVVDPLSDEKLANHVICSHRRAECLSGKMDLVDLPSRVAPNLDNLSSGSRENETSHVDAVKAQEPLQQGFIRRFITHARTTCEPRLHSIDQDKISNLYADLRRESATCGGVPIAVRHLESLMRMAEAHAKMSLRDHVRDEDVDTAISVLLTSFISAQKFSVRKSLERGFRKYLTSAGDFFHVLFYALCSLLREAQAYAALKSQHRGTPPNGVLKISVGDFEAKAREIDYIGSLDEFYKSDVFLEQGFCLDRERSHILWFPSA